MDIKKAVYSFEICNYLNNKTEGSSPCPFSTKVGNAQNDAFKKEKICDDCITPSYCHFTLQRKSFYLIFFETHFV